MKTKKAKATVMVGLLALLGLLLLSLSGRAGSLEPSAPPGPTMKTLDEVEPRIPIQTLSGSAGAMYVIDQPGSYYLTGDVNVVATDKNAINVNVDDVTIDLMGFSLIGPGSGTNYGICMNGRSNVEVRNGTVRDFGSHCIIEFDGSNGKEHRVIAVRALSNGGNGISLSGRSHLIKDCTAAENGFDGIYVGYGCTVTGNTCYNNRYGIHAQNGCTVTGNTAYNNSTSGIVVDSGSTVNGNTCYDNSSDGIYVGDGCTVTGNTAYNNTGYGIYADKYCLIDQNTANKNGTNMYTVSGCVLGTNCAP